MYQYSDTVKPGYTMALTQSPLCRFIEFYQRVPNPSPNYSYTKLTTVLYPTKEVQNI